MKTSLFLAPLFLALTNFSSAHADDTLNLAGLWQVQLHDKPADAPWQANQPAATAQMPGSLTTNGLGDDVTTKTPWLGDTNGAQAYWSSPRYAPYREPGNIKMPGWLQPVKYFTGAAHYRKEVDIPAVWQGKRIVLNLERCHWGTRVWVDDKPVPGQDLSLCTPHTHDLSGVLTPGKHTLTVEVDNRYLANVGTNASSITDHTQTNWNGFVGKTELVAGDKVWLSEVQVYPDIRAKTARVVATSCQ